MGELVQNALGMRGIPALQHIADLRHPARQGQAILHSLHRRSPARDHIPFQTEQIDLIQPASGRLIGLRQIQIIAVGSSDSPGADNSEQLL
ncbi:hypothetical protein D3C73_1200570 [compost metagenome]